MTNMSKKNSSHDCILSKKSVAMIISKWDNSFNGNYLGNVYEMSIKLEANPGIESSELQRLIQIAKE